jgi:hypothetical protein
MSEKLWKKVERDICRYFCTERELQKGREVPDGITPVFIIEVKHRKKLPEWIKKEWNGLMKKRGDRGLIPIICLHEKNQNIKNGDFWIITKARFIK